MDKKGLANMMNKLHNRSFISLHDYDKDTIYDILIIKNMTKSLIYTIF